MLHNNVSAVFGLCEEETNTVMKAISIRTCMPYKKASTGRIYCRLPRKSHDTLQTMHCRMTGASVKLCANKPYRGDMSDGSDSC